MKRHFQCAADPRMIRAWNRPSATRLATEVTFHAHHEHFVFKNTTFRALAIIPNFTEYCACHEKWHFNFTKYCACHEKWHSSLILFTHETLFTMRGVTCVMIIVLTHQILRLPRKMNLMIDPWHKWNVIYNARSNMRHSPNSPNTAPATKNDRPKSQRNLLKTDETSFPMRGRSENDPSMKPSVRNPPRNRGYFSRPPRAFCIEKYNISRSGYHSKFHRILRLPRKVTLELHQILRLPRKVTLIIDPVHTWNVIYNARSNKCHCPNSPNAAPATKNDTWTSRLDWATTWLSYDLTTWLSYYLTELWLDWAITWLSYYLTELWLDWAMTWLLDWAMTWLSYYLTELWLDWATTWLSYDLTELWLDYLTELWLDLTELWLDYLTELWLDWATTWLSYDLTELLLDWAMTWLSYDLTELLLDWAMTWLSYYLTELLLDWAITWLSYDLTELWLDWAITWLSYDLTELLLDWAITWLSYYLTELVLDWAMTWLSYDLTVLLSCDLIRISEVSQLNFLW